MMRKNRARSWVETVHKVGPEGLPKVRTSDGYLVPWNREAIINSLMKEINELLPIVYGDYSSLKITRDEAEKIAKLVENYVKSYAKFVSAPLIREIACNTMLQLSEENPKYLIYRNLYTRVGLPVYDAYRIDLGTGYEAKENANLQRGPETVHKKLADKAAKEKNLLLMPPEISTAHEHGDLHIHDLEYFSTRPFCQDWDLRYFFYYGFLPDGVGFKTSVAGPAKKPEVAVLHSVKVLAAAQTNFAGGEGFYNYLVFLAPYMRGLSYERVKQLMQMMFFELTQMYVARGGQPVFSNIQVTPGVPELWRDKPVVMHGRVLRDSYGEYEDEVRMLWDALYDVAIQGDFWGKPFNFPKLENGITPEFFRPEYDEAWLKVHEAVAKFGIPYFDNMLPEYRGYGKGVSCYQCCAYVFTETPETDPNFYDKLYFVDGAHFSMGAWQVVTLNMPRAAYRANGNDDKLLEELYRLMDLCIEIFKIKRKWMKLQIENKHLPFALQQPRDPRTGKRGPPAVDFNELVCTIGMVGVNEMVQHHVGSQLHESREAHRFALKVVYRMRKYLEELKERTGFKLALARTPAESCAQRLAIADLIDPEFREYAERVVKGDLRRARELLASGERDVPIYYSNGMHVYVGATIPLSEKLRIEAPFWPLLSGGNFFHIWLGEKNPDPEALYKLTQRIARSWIGYFAYTKDLTICSTCNNVTSGVEEVCPACGSTDIHIWSRVTGYYQNVDGWNSGKQQEFKERYRLRMANMVL